MAVGIEEVIEIKTDKITFYVTGNKIAIETGLQFLLFSPVSKYHTARLKTAQDRIVRGKTNTINGLIEDMRGIVHITPGNKQWVYDTYNRGNK